MHVYECVCVCVSVCVCYFVHKLPGKPFYMCLCASLLSLKGNLWTHRHGNTLTDTHIQYARTHTHKHMHMDGQMLHGTYLVNSKTR